MPDDRSYVEQHFELVTRELVPWIAALRSGRYAENMSSWANLCEDHGGGAVWSVLGVYADVCIEGDWEHCEVTGQWVLHYGGLEWSGDIPPNTYVGMTDYVHGSLGYSLAASVQNLSHTEAAQVAENRLDRVTSWARSHGCGPQRARRRLAWNVLG